MANRNDIYRKRRKQQMRTPYDPLGTFKNQRQYNKEVKTRARSLYNPLLQNISQEEARQGSAHEGRTRDIGGWQKDYQGQLDAAFRESRDALNNLVALGGSTNAANRDAMVAALQGDQAANDQLGATIGGAIAAPPVGQSLGEALAAPSAMDQLLTRTAGAGLAGAGERRQLAGLQGLRSLEQENLRYGGIQQGLAGQRRDVMARVPEFISQARQSVDEDQLNRQNLRFQQGLANREFGLKRDEFNLNKKNLKFQQWLAAAGFDLEKFKAHDQSNLSWSQLALDKDSLQLQRDKLNADIAAGAQGFDAQDAKRWDNAVSVLTGFTAPSDADRYPAKGDWADAHPKKAGQVNPKLYNRNHRPEDLFRTLRGQVRMSPGGALRLMLSSSNKHIRQWAHRELQRAPFRKGKHAGSLTPRNLGGAPG